MTGALMKEVVNQGRQRMQSEEAHAPVNLPSRRRLMMQQFERHAHNYAHNGQLQEAEVDHYIDTDHSLQQDPADDHDHQNLTNGSSLQAKYGLATQNNTPYNDSHLEKYTNDDPQAAAGDHYDDDDDHLQQHQSAAAAHHQKRGSTHVSVLPAKYGPPNHRNTANYSDHHYDECGEHYTDDDHVLQQVIAAEHGSRTMASQLKRAYNSRHHDKHIDHYTDDHHLVQQDFKGDHNQKKGSRITSSTLQAAQAQAAELRALHSAMLNNYGCPDRSSAVYNNYHHKQKQEDALLHKSRPNKASKKSKPYIDDEQVEELQNPLSSTSSVSSTADCFIRQVHEYPIFMPSHEDMLLSKVDGVNLMNRRSSVDNCEALMREERLNYIFDHNNKRSFSGMQYSNNSKRDNNITCLHESLNLPRRSASSLMHLHDKDDHLLHHMSLNLPQGSQHHLFNTTNYNQNPLFDQSNPSDEIASLHPMNALAGSSDTSSIKRFNDNNAPSAAPNTLMHPYELKAAFTGRQRALLEFLSEEPARMRAFNELASMETPEYDKVQMQIRSNHKDAAAIPEGNLSSSRRIKGKYESSQNVDHLQASGNHHLRQQSTGDPSFTRVRQKLAHNLNLDHHDQSTNAGGVSCDKCRPLAGAHTIAGAPSELRDPSSEHPTPNPTNTAAAASKEKPVDQKKPSIKGWFFRGKKKHNNVDLSNSQANPASVAANKVRTPITSGASSATKEIQSSASTISTAAATSHVFSSLINSEAEKELEVAMAMDLMELKVLQAKTKRDAAMAEVLELRLAMDSMAKKLVEVERHCVELKSQLMDAQAMQHQDDQMLADHQHNPPAAARLMNTTDRADVNGDEPDGAETPNTDHYESDSIDHREERIPSKGISIIRAGVSSGYGGRSSSRCVQPSKAEFLNALAEARVGIKQISRVLLQHIQERKGAGALLQAEPVHQKVGREMEESTAAGMENDQGGLMKKGIERENWGPILIMCGEAARREKTGMIGMSYSSSSSSRVRGVAYCVEALISVAFHEHFENVGFDKNGTHKILDPSQRALAFYHAFLKLAKLTPTQLLTQPSPLYNPAFDRFCSRKMRTLGRAVGCPARLWPDELARTFLSTARAVWLLHHLAFAYHSRPPGIFRVAANSSFDARFMEVLPSDHRHVSPSSHLVVSLMVMPGFFLPDDIVKCKVLAS